MNDILYIYENAFKMWYRRLAGIYDAARERGWHVEPVNADDMRGGAGRLLAYWKPSGVVVEGGVLRRRGYGAGAFAKTPAVFCDVDAGRMKTSYFGVRVDARNMVRDAARELFARDLAHHGFVHFHTRRDWSLEREALFRAEAAACGKDVSVFKTWSAGGARRRSDAQTDRERLAAWLATLPRPCGILAANDEMAAQVLRTAMQGGIAVPEEMAVVGFDDDALLCENTYPTLTSIAPDFARSGRVAVDLLARRLAGGAVRPAVVEVGCAPLVRRRSSMVIGHRDIRIVKAVEYIRLNIGRGIGVADVARQMGMTRRTAENRFRETVGRAIRDELTAARLTRAKALLADARTPIGDIHAQCGYAHERALRALFLREEGLSPSAWRKRRARDAMRVCADFFCASRPVKPGGMCYTAP